MFFIFIYYCCRQLARNHKCVFLWCIAKRIRLISSMELKSSVIFRLNWCSMHAAPAAVRSVHMEHGEEYVHSHSALPREGPSLNAASRWDTCLPQDCQWFIPTVQCRGIWCMQYFNLNIIHAADLVNCVNELVVTFSPDFMYPLGDQWLVKDKTF